MFKELGIPAPVLRVIEEEKFETPSEIQVKSVPLVIAGKDVIACSATGSGKTLAFAAGIINKVEKGQGLQALVLTPTRELAEQVAKEFRKYSRYKPMFTAAIYGGVSINPQFNELRRADIVIGTPGRILDHLQRRSIDLSKVKTLVLDEADRMLDMGFVDDVERIIRTTPKDRQTLLFSATITDDVSRLSSKYLIDPQEVSVDNQVDPTLLKQVYYNPDNNMKFSLLVHLIKNDPSELTMVFCNSQRNTDFVARNLKSLGINSMAIHGGFSQAKRSHAMEMFHKQNIKVLVCTDVAARGLDIKGVSHVYNYDIPKDSKQYVHRIGRTARAGAEGIAVNIVTERDYDNFSRVLRDNDVHPELLETPQVERAKIASKDMPRGFRGDSEGYGNRGGYGNSRGHTGGYRGGQGGPRHSQSSGARPHSGGYRPHGGSRPTGGHTGGGHSGGQRRHDENSGWRT